MTPASTGNLNQAQCKFSQSASASASARPGQRKKGHNPTTDEMGEWMTDVLGEGSEVRILARKSPPLPRQCAASTRLGDFPKGNQEEKEIGSGGDRPRSGPGAEKGRFWISQN